VKEGGSLDKVPARFRVVQSVIAAAVICMAVAAEVPRRRNEVLWRDPGPVEELDFHWGPGGRRQAPSPPFRFVKEDDSGTKAKVNVVDARGRHWNVKFGYEVPGECFGPRLMWAAGYFAEPAYFVPSGKIHGVREPSKRLRQFVAGDGSFTRARFQLRDPSLKFLKDRNWAWTNNPFQGTHELAGLKILIMLASNWDNKDARDQDEGINTAIFEQRGKSHRYIYTFTDWGVTLGGWGPFLTGVKAWSCPVYQSQTPGFVTVSDGRIQWGYVGRHRDFKQDVGLDDIRWSLRTIGRITDRQLIAGLLASGATTAEADCFARELRRRIEMLRAIASKNPRPVQ
jgi:hypothetical protein